MYIGIGPENSDKRVLDEDAFSYALEQCLIGADRDEFKKAFKNDYIHGGGWFLRPKEFREDLVEWFYSGNWTYGKEE